MSADAQARCEVDPGLDVGAVMRLVSVHTTSPHAGEVWWATRTRCGPATVRLVQVGPGVVEAESWGEGAEQLLGEVPVLLGDQPEQFTSHHEVVTQLLRRGRLGLHLPTTNRVFEAIVPAILGQKVQTVAASDSLRGILWQLGEPAPGPLDRLRLLPKPEVFAEVGYAGFHRFNVERKRATTMITAARRADWLERLGDRTPGQRAAGLTSLHGIGPWTAAVVAMTAWGDGDAVPVGDFHIPNTVAWGLAGEERGTDERMLELLEPYAGHRGRVIRLLKGGGVHAPRRGPKLGVMDNRHR